MTARPVTLRLDHWRRRGADVRDGLSAARAVGPHLWLACDETAALERLTLQPDGAFAAHAPFPLADLLDLPGKADGEADIEALAFDGGHLWVIGSQSRKRKKPKPGMAAAEAAARLATLKHDANRYLLARLPLGEDGAPLPRGAARLAGGKRGNLLTQALARDAHLGAFMKLPGKDNGLDVEGLVADCDRLLLGLRGPVLRGWAVVVEIRVVEGAGARLRLGAPPRKHFLDLGGLGIRDLCRDGDDLLVMAGPTMDLPGPFAVHRWHGGAAAGDGDDLVPAGRLPRVLEFPWNRGAQKPEGMTLLDAPGLPPGLLVVYDEPAEHRKPAAGEVICDLFPKP